MVDIHCHIVPEVDDGAWNLNAAMEMARMAVRCGVTRIIATPHFQGVRESLEELPHMMRQLERLRSAVREENLRLELLPGAEILCLPQTLELARKGKLPTLGDSRYVLTEFYFDASREFMDMTLTELRRWGYQPVVAHPERYGAVQREPELAGRWFAQGIVLQINKGSVLGALGHRAEEAAVQLLRRGTAHIIASDAHSPEVRTTDLTMVRRWALEHLGREYTGILLEENPGRVCEGRPMRGVRRGEESRVNIIT